jgi:hypothetical protein
MPYTTDADLPEISDAMMAEGLASTRPFTLMVLHTGPRFDASPETLAIIREHGRRNFALRAAGLLRIVCPVNDGTDMAGIGVWDADPDVVTRIYQDDPAVQQGILTCEIHASRSFPGDALPS